MECSVSAREQRKKRTKRQQESQENIDNKRQKETIREGEVILGMIRLLAEEGLISLSEELAAAQFLQGEAG